jgi:DNA-binding NtrC family response regulator
MRGKESGKSDQKPLVLVADDDPNIRVLLDHNLQGFGFATILAEDGQDAIEKMTDEVSVALIDLSMPRMNGMECLRRIRAEYSGVEVIVVTASGEIADAIEATKEGAYYFVTKPVNLEEIFALVQQACQSSALKAENKQLKGIVSETRPLGKFAGDAPAIRELLDRVHKIADLDSSVLITGESGVGKGLLARTIHYSGQRAEHPFVTVSCTALPRELVESELFGHEKGAFTGAQDRRLGRLEVAHGGTLFLDEIGDMPLDLQPKLLTFLQEHAFQRIGSNRVIEVDVRVIAATHQNLPALILEGRFRADLFYRLNVLPLEIPPLRKRAVDVPPLCISILNQIARRRKHAGFTLCDDALKALVAYQWPGNIRELENVLERATAFCDSDQISARDLPSLGQTSTPSDAGSARSLASLTLVEVEKMAIEQTLEACGGNKAQSARVLGITEKSIYNKMKRLGLS